MLCLRVHLSLLVTFGVIAGTASAGQVWILLARGRHSQVTRAAPTTTWPGRLPGAGDLDASGNLEPWKRQGRANRGHPCARAPPSKFTVQVSLSRASPTTTTFASQQRFFPQHFFTASFVPGTKLRLPPEAGDTCEFARLVRNVLRWPSVTYDSWGVRLCNRSASGRATLVPRSVLDRVRLRYLGTFRRQAPPTPPPFHICCSNNDVNPANIEHFLPLIHCIFP